MRPEQTENEIWMMPQQVTQLLKRLRLILALGSGSVYKGSSEKARYIQYQLYRRVTVNLMNQSQQIISHTEPFLSQEY